MSALNLSRDDEEYCNVLGAFIADVYKPGVTFTYHGSQYIQANNTRVEYLAAILPSNITRPDNYTLSLWWDALYDECKFNELTAGGSYKPNLIDEIIQQISASTKCEVNICKHLEWNGDQDVSGNGV